MSEQTNTSALNEIEVLNTKINVLNKEIKELKDELKDRENIVEEKEQAHRDIMKELQETEENLSISQTNHKRA